MRALAVLFTLLFSINLADANQQVLLRVQWQQLALQNSLLSLQEKVDKIQGIASLIEIDQQRASQVVKTPLQVFEQGQATQAEIAFAKWYMLKELGVPAEQFRLVYVKDKQATSTEVWLAWYQTQQVKIITQSDVYEGNLDHLRRNRSLEVVSVVDPQLILKSRQSTRTASLQQQGAVFL